MRMTRNSAGRRRGPTVPTRTACRRRRRKRAVSWGSAHGTLPPAATAAARKARSTSPCLWYWPFVTSSAFFCRAPPSITSKFVCQPPLPVSGLQRNRIHCRSTAWRSSPPFRFQLFPSPVILFHAWPMLSLLTRTQLLNLVLWIAQARMLRRSARAVPCDTSSPGFAALHERVGSIRAHGRRLPARSACARAA
jgi:hypothetical protein